MKKILKLLTIILLLAVMQTARAAEVPIKYIDADGTEKECASFTVLTGSETNLQAGWYVVNDDITFVHKIEFSGDVNLILADGATMTVTPESADYGFYGSSALTIYGQSAQTGSLKISGCSLGVDYRNGDFTLNGCNVDINSVTYSLSCDDVIINGGEINLENQNRQAIYAKTCTINGGKVKATTNAGVGYSAIFADEITLGCSKSDDYIEATSYYANNSFSIADGQTLTDGNGNYYSGTLDEKQIGTLKNIKLTRVSYFSLPVCFEITNGAKLIDGRYIDTDTEVKFKLRSGLTLINGVEMNGEPLAADENGIYTVTADKNITITATATIEVAYINSDGTEMNVDAIPLTGSETNLQTGWYVVKDDITFDHTINYSGEVNLILADGATMMITLDPTSNTNSLNCNETNSALTIYGQSAQTGALKISGCRTGVYNRNGDFTLNGCNVDINSMTYSLSCDDVIINGGEINLESQINKAIYANTCTINGGKVKATTDGSSAIFADEITLGCSKSDDYIEATSYYAQNSFSIADGQTLTDGNGNYYSGTLDEEQISTLKNTKLTRAYSFSLPDGFEITNDAKLIESKYVAAGTEVMFQLKSGVTLDGDVKMNGNTIYAPNGIYSVTANEDVKITASLSVAYIDADGNEAEKNPGEYTFLTGNEDQLAAGWYVAAGEISFDHTIEFSDDVHIIFADGANMTVTTKSYGEDYGINGSENSALTIYGQSTQTGALKISSCYRGVNIHNNGVITINGGKVDIKSFEVSLWPGEGSVIINGGEINLENQYSQVIYAKTCTINGGKVKVTTNASVVYSAIYADKLTIGCAKSDDYIEAASYYAQNSFSIADGQTLTDGNGNYYSGTLDEEQIAALAGKKLTRVYSFFLPGCFEITNDVELNEGKYADYGTEVKFQLKSCFTLDGDVEVNGETLAADENGIYTVTADKDITIIASAFFSVAYIDADGNKAEKKSDEYTFLTGIEDVLYDGWYVAAGEISFDHTIILTGKVNLILTDGATMTIAPEDADDNGLSGSEYCALTIYGQSKQTGALKISSCADGVYFEESGDFTIYGGKVDIKSQSCSLMGNLSVVINGGDINLESRENNAIYVNTCTINGGKVKATTNVDLYSAIEAEEITLGCTNSDDYIEVTSYQAYNSLSIADGQLLTDGENYYVGTLSKSDEKALAGKKLIRADVVSVSLPNYMEIINGVTLLGGKFVERGSEVEFKLKSGFVLDGDVMVNGNTIYASNGVYSVTANEDVTITATVSVAYIAADGNEAEKKYDECTFLTGSEDKLYDGWYVAAGEISFDHQIEFHGDVHIILVDGANVTPKDDEDGVEDDDEAPRPPEVPRPHVSLDRFGLVDGEVSSTLTIYGQSEQSGKLSISDFVGVMGKEGTFTVNGGKVDIKSLDVSLFFPNGSVVINGGEINIESQEYHAIDAYTCTINGGKVKATTSAISADDIILGCTKSDDYIEAKSYNAFNSLSIADGQTLTDGNGNYYSGTLDEDQVSALAGKKLTRATLAITTAPAAIKKLTYRSNDVQELVTAGVSNYGKVLYSLSADGEYTEDIPTGKDAKTYTVYYKAKSGDEETAVASVEVVIGDYVIENGGALIIAENQNGKIAILDGAYTGEDFVSISEDHEVDKVIFSRSFTNGATSTIILPFDIREGNYSGGTFYKLNGIYADNGEWTAEVNKVTDVTAHTPYIFVPDGNEFTITGPVTIKKTDGVNTSVNDGNWTFTGVYQRKRWGAEDGNNKDYCFAANQTDNVNIGDFVKIGTFVQLKPFRCYLTYNSISKATTILPESIKVRIVDETASVIDNPTDPVDEHNGDFETPVSEIIPAANVNVWSYDKTIYISAAAGTNYRIIDSNGRDLASGITATDRDEIRLGNRSGIVIVIINGKTYKLNY